MQWARQKKLHFLKCIQIATSHTIGLEVTSTRNFRFQRAPVSLYPKPTGASSTDVPGYHTLQIVSLRRAHLQEERIFPVTGPGCDGTVNANYSLQNATSPYVCEWATFLPFKIFFNKSRVLHYVLALYLSSSLIFLYLHRLQLCFDEEAASTTGAYRFLINPSTDY